MKEQLNKIEKNKTKQRNDIIEGDEKLTRSFVTSASCVPDT